MFVINVTTKAPDHIDPDRVSTEVRLDLLGVCHDSRDVRESERRALQDLAKDLREATADIERRIAMFDPPVPSGPVPSPSGLGAVGAPVGVARSVAVGAGGAGGALKAPPPAARERVVTFLVDWLASLSAVDQIECCEELLKEKLFGKKILVAALDRLHH